MNRVLYAVSDGIRRPLVSVDENDAAASFKVANAINGALATAQRAGSPAPEFKLVAETHEADSTGRNHVSRYDECDLTTLKPKEGKRAVSSLDQLFAKG
jgi:hypothetical protein